MQVLFSLYAPLSHYLSLNFCHRVGSLDIEFTAGDIFFGQFTSLRLNRMCVCVSGMRFTISALDLVRKFYAILGCKHAYQIKVLRPCSVYALKMNETFTHNNVKCTSKVRTNRIKTSHSLHYPYTHCKLNLVYST